MSISGNQAAVVADVISTYRVEAERESVLGRIVAMVRTWRDGRHEARASARERHRQHVERHWHQLESDYSESWRWQANGS